MIGIVLGLLAHYTCEQLKKERQPITISRFAEASLKAIEETKQVLKKAGLYPKRKRW